MTEAIQAAGMEAALVAGLRGEVRGEVVGPSDPGYDEARGVYITGLSRRPAAVVRVADGEDVARVVRFARDEGVELAVRAGGHSMAGHGTTDGGIVIDLSALRAVEVDVAGRTAWAGGGLTAGEYLRATSAHGLVTQFGDTPTVGIGGITLSGGVGYLHRKYGMTIDGLLAAEVVTADGERVRADAESHPDLFWAIRGGGGNFGVVTRFQYRLHEVDQVVGGMMILPATPDVLHGLVAYLDAAPDELSGILGVMVAPPMPMIPAEAHGKPVIMGLFVHSEGGEAGEKAFAPIRALAAPIADHVQSMPYMRMYDEGGPPKPAAMAGRTMFLDGLDRSAAEALIDGVRRSTAMMSVTQIRPLGGAMARVPADATAFPHRERRLLVNVAAMFGGEAERATHDAWAASVADSIGPADRAAYVGFLAADDPGRVRDAYGAATWERLREVKRRYDPANVFRRNHNVSPAQD